MTHAGYRSLSFLVGFDLSRLNPFNLVEFGKLNTRHVLHEDRRALSHMSPSTIKKPSNDSSQQKSGEGRRFVYQSRIIEDGIAEGKCAFLGAKPRNALSIRRARHTRVLTVFYLAMSKIMRRSVGNRPGCQPGGRAHIFEMVYEFKR